MIEPLVVLCPNCHGQKTVSRPPWMAGDQPTWESDGTGNYNCPTCQAMGYLFFSSYNGKATPLEEGQGS